MEIDGLKYYDLECYLLNDVGPRFRRDGNLSVEDFFCIVIWKAERAKSRIATLLKKQNPNLSEAVAKLSQDLHAASMADAKFKILFDDWKFSLPMATAILGILYPDDFTVYDFRVCEQLNSRDMSRLGNLSTFEKVWDGYKKYIELVRTQAPHLEKLRDKDRWLWGKSFYRQLQADAARGFPTPKEREASEALLAD